VQGPSNGPLLKAISHLAPQKSIFRSLTRCAHKHVGFYSLTLLVLFVRRVLWFCVEETVSKYRQDGSWDKSKLEVKINVEMIIKERSFPVPQCFQPIFIKHSNQDSLTSCIALTTIPMYLSRASKVVIPLSVISQLAVSSPTIQTLAQRQDTVRANFQLLGPNADCFDFSFDSNTFSATCISVDGIPVPSSVNLDACITNDDGNMVYRSEYVSE
jgi:hypothetical protein